MPDQTQATMFKEACLHPRLLQDDAEWHQAILDAALTSMPPQIRAVYLIILEFCNPADPVGLVTRHWVEMAEDFAHKHNSATPDQLRAMLAMDIECSLRDKNSSLEHFGITAIAPTNEVRSQVEMLDEVFRVVTLPLVRRVLLAYDGVQELQKYQDTYPLLQPAQNSLLTKLCRLMELQFS